VQVTVKGSSPIEDRIRKLVTYVGKIQRLHRFVTRMNAELDHIFTNYLNILTTVTNTY
jgi:hypothetical protein